MLPEDRGGAEGLDSCSALAPLPKSPKGRGEQEGSKARLTLRFSPLPFSEDCQVLCRNGGWVTARYGGEDGGKGEPSIDFVVGADLDQE